jgi:hypothetical protein
VTIAGEQPHALAVALNDEAVAIVLDLMEPFRPSLGPWSRGLEGLERSCCIDDD